jgi:hypothetical protein
MRFRRVLKGIGSARACVTTSWRPYWGLDLDPDKEGFTVYLNPGRTRLIRSWRHTTECAQCQGIRHELPDLETAAHW